MISLFAASALAEPGHSFVGVTRSQGNSPVQLCLRPMDDSTVVAELWWAAYDRVSFEKPTTMTAGCDDPRLAGGRSLVRGDCRAILTTVADKHPLYDYVEHRPLRCLITAGGAACKLPYTGWFVLAPAADGCVAAR